MFLVALFLSATFARACFHPLDFISFVLNPANAHLQITPRIIAFALAFVGLAINASMFLLVKYATRENVWKCIIGVFGAYLFITLIVAVFAAGFTGLTWERSFFGCCCASLALIGSIWNLSYQEICVIINIYLQAGIILLSAYYLGWTAIQRFRIKKTPADYVVMWMALVYNLAMTGCFILVMYHYAMPMNDAFALCYQELIAGAKALHITYNEINYLIFILLFLVFTIGNIMAARFLRIKPLPKEAGIVKPIFN